MKCFTVCEHQQHLCCTRLEQWHNRWGRGRVPPPETSDREIFADISGKKGKGVKIEKKRRKIVKGKVENWKWK